MSDDFRQRGGSPWGTPPGGGGGGYWNATPDPIANGVANTGGGGGSRGPSPVSIPSGAGGSGILIIRYAL